MENEFTLGAGNWLSLFCSLGVHANFLWIGTVA